ncbi:MAG: hypothetical protein ACKOXP_09440 [Flavobacteriales bacterium]
MKSVIAFCLGLFLVGIPGANAQEIDPDDSFTFEIALPNAMYNQPYKTIMQGLIQSSANYQYTLKNGLSFGAGLHYTYFAINEFRVPSKVYGGIHSAAAYVKIGHEKFWSERFGTDFGVKMGYLQSYTVSDLLKSKGIPYNFIESTYIEPCIGFVITADVNCSYRLNIGYPIYGYGFTPWMIGIDSNIGYDPKEYTKPSSFLSVGFAYTYYFNGKKSAAED